MEKTFAKKVISILFLIFSITCFIIINFIMLLMKDFLLLDFVTISLLLAPCVLLIASVIFFASVFIGDVFSGLSLIISLLGIIISISPIIYFAPILTQNQQNSVFSSEKWITKQDARAAMVDSLLKRKDLYGKSKDDIKNLLGEPNKEKSANGRDEFYYYIASDKTSDWLVVEFEDNEVTDILVRSE